MVKKIKFAGKAALSCIAFLACSAAARADVVINEKNFPDENFRKCLLRKEYGADSLLTDAEIADIKEIAFRFEEIKSLQGIEYFTALEGLGVENNQLTTLDVTRNPKLQWLFCDKNQLTSLNVSANPELTELLVTENRLTSLNVRNNTALQRLECSMNRLTSLDVTHNTALRYLYCYCNKLTSLDITCNTALERLDCASNQLTSLNLSQNPKLKSLYCDYNQLTQLDVSACDGLRYLDCYLNQIKGAAMDALVASMPTTNEYCEMAVIYYENEHNIITTTQVAAAKAKGWKVLHCAGADRWGWEEWVDYPGSEDATHIQNPESPSHNPSDIYDLNGRKITSQLSPVNSQLPKGIYIIGGKKVWMK